MLKRNLIISFGLCGLLIFGVVSFSLIRSQSKVESNHQDQLHRLRSLPYLQGYIKATNKKNVTIYDKNLAYKGVNLYNSAHSPVAGIMDMEGNMLHTWTYPCEEVWPEMMEYASRAYWRRVCVCDNGDILAIYEVVGKRKKNKQTIKRDKGMIRLDKNSNLLWVFEEDLERGPHHDVVVGDNQNIYVLTRKLKNIPRINKDKKVFEEFITVLNADGEVIEEHSLLKCFKNSSFAYILDKIDKRAHDIFHTNSLQLLDGSLSHISPLFKKGNVLSSITKLKTVIIVDLEKDQVVWALRDNMWRGIHDATLLPNGNILLFCNAKEKNKRSDKKSHIIEFNPLTKEIIWQYPDSKDVSLYSRVCGSNQRLPNGNTLITEFTAGRAIEVTKDGKIVWEYINLGRIGENNELIACLLHMRRINRDSLKWLNLKTSVREFRGHNT